MAKVKIFFLALFLLTTHLDIIGDCPELIRTCIMDVYRSQLGVRELTGNNDGVEVQMYLNSSGIKPGAPWCAAFVNWVFVVCNSRQGKRFHLPGSAWSPSWFPKRQVIINSEALAGDVFGIWFRRLNRIAHVGFIDESWTNGNSTILTVEGNTNEGGSREGDGVYRKRRNKNQIHKISNWAR